MILVTFHSVSSALLLDRLLRARGMDSAVIPVPRRLSSSCGYAVRTGTDDAAPAPAEIIALMDAEEVEWEAVYPEGDPDRRIDPGDGPSEGCNGGGFVIR